MWPPGIDRDVRDSRLNFLGSHIHSHSVYAFVFCFAVSFTMSSLLRHGFRALAQPLYSQTSTAISTSVRHMSVDGVKSFRDREAAAEVCMRM